MKDMRFVKAGGFELVGVIAIFAIAASAAPALKKAAVKKPVATKTVAAKPKPAKPAAFDEWMSETGDPTPAVKTDIVKAVPATEETARLAPAGPIPVAKPVSAVTINPVTRNDTEAKETFTLAQSRQAAAPIILSDKASPATQAVAKDLADILHRMCGATFEIKTGDGTSGIVLGTMQEFPQPKLAAALQIKNGFNGKESYAIRTTEKRLLLLGATDLGASHAAYRLLNELGYRSFFPDAVWEVVPKVNAVTFERDITDRPEILARNIWFEAGSGTGKANDDYANWRRRNAQAESFVVNAGHNMDSVAAANKAEFDKHPEYWAGFPQPDGSIKREGPQLELSNPVVRQMVVDYAINFFKANPNADMVSLDPADTHNHSQTKEALAMGSVSDRVYGMANEAARAVEKAFPGQGKMVGLYSYNEYWDPPSFKLEPNVHVLMSGLGQGKYTPAERQAIWPSRSSNRGVYEYYGVFLWSYDKLPGSYTNNVHGIKQVLESYAGNGITSISAESTSNWGISGRGYYNATKLMWNPHQDVDALMADFYEKAFGPAAPAMKRYYERLDPGSGQFLSRQLIGLSFRDIDEATRLAQGRPDVQARLDFIKLYLRYAYLEWAQNRDGKKDIGAEIPSLYGRNRNRAIFTFEMARQTWWGGINFETDELKKPYTHEEIEKGFQEGLNYFPVRNDIGDPVKYSADMVPVVWTAEQKGTYTPPAEIKQTYQGAMKYGLYSLHGEPLEFTTKAGNAWGGINRYSLKNAKGDEVATATLKNDATTVHKIAVPGPGLYWLEYNDNGSYWEMYANRGTVSTLALGMTYDYRNSSIPAQMFFYVPKGIKNIEYYYSRTAFHPGGPHKVVDPTGKVVKDVDVNGDWVTVPVPAGMDGKLWSFLNPVLGFFTFNNLPNYYAATPEGLMVPREVAEKDGLVLRK